MSVSSTRIFTTISLAFSLSFAAQAMQGPVEQVQQTFRSSVDLVTIQASVRDKRGKPMRGLTPGDFEIRDNGQLR